MIEEDVYDEENFSKCCNAITWRIEEDGMWIYSICSKCKNVCEIYENSKLIINN